MSSGCNTAARYPLNGRLYSRPEKSYKRDREYKDEERDRTRERIDEDINPGEDSQPRSTAAQWRRKCSHKKCSAMVTLLPIRVKTRFREIVNTPRPIWYNIHRGTVHKQTLASSFFPPTRETAISWVEREMMAWQIIENHM